VAVTAPITFITETSRLLDERDSLPVAAWLTSSREESGLTGKIAPFSDRAG
jgi:hypothetical protein